MWYYFYMVRKRFFFHSKHKLYATLLTSQYIPMTSFPLGSQTVSVCSFVPLCYAFRRAHDYEGGAWRSLQLPSAGAGARWQLWVHQHTRLRNQTHSVISVDYSVRVSLVLNSWDIKQSAVHVLYIGQRDGWISWHSIYIWEVLSKTYLK